ncbi:MAG TPA: cytochrome c, partial [Flavisolibacter sp.]|nr:cytochrome c [Flavisolibacter sp.]
MNKFIFILLMIMVTGCAKKIAPPANVDMIKMQTKVPGITLENGTKGYRLYRSKCASCHYLHQPGQFTEEEWNTILPRMFKKLKNTDEIERLLIKDYLISM